MEGSRLGSYVWRAFLSGLGNIWPSVEVEFWNAAEKGDTPAAQKIVFEQEVPYLRHLFRRKYGRNHYFAGVKALLDMAGLPGGPMRPPLLDWRKDDLPALRKMAIDTGLLTDRSS